MRWSPPPPSHPKRICIPHEYVLARSDEVHHGPAPGVRERPRRVRRRLTSLVFGRVLRGSKRHCRIFFRFWNRWSLPALGRNGGGGRGLPTKRAVLGKYGCACPPRLDVRFFLSACRRLVHHVCTASSARVSAPRPSFAAGPHIFVYSMQVFFFFVRSCVFNSVPLDVLLLGRGVPICYCSRFSDSMRPLSSTAGGGSPLRFCYSEAAVFAQQATK